MKIIQLSSTSHALIPFVASLQQRTSRLGFVFSFHIDEYASFLRRRKLEPLVTSTYVTPFETLIGKMR